MALDAWKGKKNITLRDLLEIRALSDDPDQSGPLLFKETTRYTQIRSAMAFLKHYYRFDFLRAKTVGEYYVHEYRDDEHHVRFCLRATSSGVCARSNTPVWAILSILRSRICFVALTFLFLRHSCFHTETHYNECGARRILQSWSGTCAKKWAIPFQPSNKKLF